MCPCCRAAVTVLLAVTAAVTVMMILVISVVMMALTVWCKQYYMR